MSNTKLPALSDAQIDDLMPEPDGTAEADKTPVVIQGIPGYDYTEVDAWSAPLVRQTVRSAILADRERQAGEAVAWAHELLRRSRGYVEHAAKQFYDGTDGESTLQAARNHLAKIDAELASLPAPQAVQADIAAAIHYPECWDTAAYPTLESALAEVYAHFRCTNQDTHAADSGQDARADAEAFWRWFYRKCPTILSDQVRALWMESSEYAMLAAAPSPDGKAEQAEAPSGCELKCTEVCKAKEHGCASECPALPWQPAATQPTASNAGEREDAETAFYDWCPYDGVQRSDKEHFVAGYRAALASKPPAGEQVPTDVLAAIKRAGFTLVKTAHAYHLMRLGDAVAQSTAQPEQVAQDSEQAADYRWLAEALTSNDPYGELAKAFGHFADDHTPSRQEFDDAIRAARARGEGGAKG